MFLEENCKYFNQTFHYPSYEFNNFIVCHHKLSLHGTITSFLCRTPSVFCKCVLQPQRLQPLASPKLEILLPGPRSKLENYKIMRNVRKAHITSAKREVPCGRGPGSSGVLDALWCNLSLILEAFYQTNLFIYF